VVLGSNPKRIRLQFRPSPAVGHGPQAAALLLLAALLGISPWQVSAAATLGEAVRSVLALAGQAQRVDAERALGAALRRQGQGLLADDPALRLKLLSDRATGDHGTYELEGMVDLPLLLPGQRSARLALADRTTVAADALQRRLHWETAGLVRDAVWEAALAEAGLRQAEAALGSAQALEATVARREAAGELAELDLLLARQETLARQSDLDAARAAQAEAMAAYRALTGLAELPVPLAEPAPALVDEPSVPPAHPLLASLEQTVAQARAERARVDADRRGTPVLSLGAKHERADRSAPEDDALQIEVSLPFGLERIAAPALARAERDYTEQLAELQQARRRLARDVATARVAVAGAAQRLTSARERAEVTERSLKLARRAFDLGEADLAALLRAEERARDARLSLALRELEQGRALSRLNQALGVLPE
jgi:outer membrane protein TolC